MRGKLSQRTSSEPSHRRLPFAVIMLRLRNRFLPLLRASQTHPDAWRFLSTSTSSTTTAFSLEDYLVAACGLAPAQAREVPKKASRELLSHGSRGALDELSHSRLNSASNPDAILALLSGAGLSRADIAAVISADPLLLRASVKNTAPCLLALRDLVGLSTPQIARFLLVGSRALRVGDVVPRLEFFISFYGSFEQVLVVAKRNSASLRASLFTLLKLGEDTFKLRFIDCHKDSVPGLADAYATACAGIIVPSGA